VIAASLKAAQEVGDQLSPTQPPALLDVGPVGPGDPTPDFCHLLPANSNRAPDDAGPQNYRRQMPAGASAADLSTPKTRIARTHSGEQPRCKPMSIQSLYS
jgi:hypothetical protein